MARPRIISPELRAFIIFKKGTSVEELVRQTGVSRSHIFNIWREATHIKTESKTPKSVGGRPSKLSMRDKRRIMRTVKILRSQDPNWTVKRIIMKADLHAVSRRTVSRYLNKQGLRYLQARKKGLMTERDKSKRLKFAKTMQKNDCNEFWSKNISFYLDGVGFVYKRNPLDQALAPRGRVWRKKSEGLIQGCTGKGQACGTGGKYVKMIVAITYGKGVICCQRYEKMNGTFFASFLKENFEMMVKKADKNSRIWIQDGDPSQNSKQAKEVMKELNSELLSIPPRSPDLNPIENFFGIVKQQLNRDAIEKNITSETMDELESRIREVMTNMGTATIDKIIESMNKRIQMVIDCKGERTKY